MADTVYDFELQRGWNSLDSEIVKDQCQDGDACPVPAIWSQMIYKCIKAN